MPDERAVVVAKRLGPEIHRWNGAGSDPLDLYRTAAWRDLKGRWVPGECLGLEESVWFELVHLDQLIYTPTEEPGRLIPTATGVVKRDPPGAGWGGVGQAMVEVVELNRVPFLALDFHLTESEPLRLLIPPEGAEWVAAIRQALRLEHCEQKWVVEVRDLCAAFLRIATDFQSRAAAWRERRGRYADCVSRPRQRFLRVARSFRSRRAGRFRSWGCSTWLRMPTR